MNSARIELQRSFFVTQARVVVVVVDEVGAPEIMGVLNFPKKLRRAPSVLKIQSL